VCAQRQAAHADDKSSVLLIGEMAERLTRDAVCLVGVALPEQVLRARRSDVVQRVWIVRTREPLDDGHLPLETRAVTASRRNMGKLEMEGQRHALGRPLLLQLMGELLGLVPPTGRHQGVDPVLDERGRHE
jgi:hypothetical protein